MLSRAPVGYIFKMPFESLILPGVRLLPRRRGIWPGALNLLSVHEPWPSTRWSIHTGGADERGTQSTRTDLLIQGSLRARVTPGVCDAFLKGRLFGLFLPRWRGDGRRRLLWSLGPRAVAAWRSRGGG